MHGAKLQLASVILVVKGVKGAFTSKIKHAIRLKTSPARFVQLLQPSVAFCFSLQSMTAVTAHRPVRLAGLVLSFIACFILLVIAC